MSAETGEGAAGCVQRQEPRLGAEPEEREAEGARGPEGRQRLRAHVGEGVVAGVGLEHPEAEQDGDRAHVGDQQVQEPGAADLGDAVVGGDEEEGGERHHLPGHHEGVGVVGQQHHRHAGEEEVVVQAQEPRRRALALAEVAAGEDGDAGAREAQQREEEGRERVQAQVEGQVRQADGEDGDLRRAGQGRESEARQREAQRGGEREEDARDEGEVVQRRDPGQADREPRDDDEHDAVDREEFRQGAHREPLAACRPGAHTVSTVASRK